MKRLFLMIMILALSFMLFSCGDCEEHIDENSDGFCDECEEKMPDIQEKDPQEIPDEKNPDGVDLPEIKF